MSPAVVKMGQGSFHGVIDSYYYGQVEIGNYTSIAPPLYIHGNTEHPCVFDKNLVSTYPFGDKWETRYPKSSSKGIISIGSDVWIGESVTLLSGIKIADGAIIGARSVIAKSVPPFAVVVGNPAKVVRYRFSPITISKLLQIKWWEWPIATILARIEYMKDINALMKEFS